MKQIHTRRDKGRALFLAALMVLSVFAMSVSFAGAAAAAHNPQSEVSIENGDRLYQGQTALVQYGDLAATTNGTVDADTTVDLLNEDGDWIREYQISAGADASEELAVDTSNREAGSYKLSGDTDVGFDVRVQTLTAEFSDDQVVEGSNAASNATVAIDSERASFQTEVSADGLDGQELQTIFGDQVVSVHDDYVVIEDRGDFTADLSELEPGEYEFNFDVADTDASDTATIEVNESSGANAEFDQSTYSEEAGDVVSFTVNMENTDSAQVELTEEDDNYNAVLDVNDVDGDGEVTVYFNTYLAGDDNPAAFYTAEDSDDTVNIAVDENSELQITDNTGESRLLPADFDLQLFVGEGDSREEVDVSALFLTEGSIGDVTTGIAPSDAGLDGDSSVEDITNETTESNEVAEGDTVVFAYEASGVFGAIDADDFDTHFDIQIRQIGDQYDNGQTLEQGADYEVVEDAENNRFFIIMNTNEMEAGEDYELTLEPTSDYFNDVDSVSTEFSVVERMIEVTGDFNKEDQLLVPNDEEATVTGESTAAPGTDVTVRLRATGEDPFLMSQTVQVQEDGSVEATFDLSNHQAGQEFTVTMTDRNADDVQDQVNAILTESGPAPHSVVIHVEDADGNAVSGAEITVGDQSATTDDDGKATLELAHGEYKVNASYDGVEANGKLTVDDQTPDEITLTLGEEDVDYNEKANEDEQKDDEQKDEKQNDEKQSDEKQNDENNDDEQPGSGADEQPGFGIAVALVALLAAAGIALRRQ